MNQPSHPEPHHAQEDSQLNTASLPMLCWRSFKALSRLIIYIPLSVLILIAILIGTHFGSRITVLLADILVPDLNITYVTGTINSQLKVKDTHWEMNGISVDIKELNLKWLPMCLLKSKFA